MGIARYPRRRLQTRAAYARTNGNLLINNPDGFPSDYPPVPWAGGYDGDGNPPIWWVGSDSAGGAEPIGPNGPWPLGCAPLPAVTRATALITGPLTAAPFELVDPSQPGRDLPEPRWMTDPMLLRPDSRIGPTWPAVTRLARSNFWAEWVRSAIWWGEGPFVSVEDESGQPIAGTLRMLNPLVLGTKRTSAGRLVWCLDETNNAPEIVFDEGPRPGEPGDGYAQVGPVRYKITVLRNPHSPVTADGRSLGVFAMNPAAFKLGRQIQAYTSGTFRSGIPAGYLKVNSPDMSQEAANQLKRRWLAAHGGDRRSIAVLNAVTEFVPLNMSPVDSELAQVERLNIAEIAYAFGLDPNTLGVTMAQSMTYTNIRDAWLNHRDFGLAPWIAAVQDTLTALTPNGQQVQVDLDGFANPTRQERYTAYKTGIDAGIVTVDEVRQWEGLPPMPEEDKKQIPPALQLANQQAQAELDQQTQDGEENTEDQEQAS